MPHPGVVTLDGRVVGDKVEEDSIVVEVSGGELMMCNKEIFKRKRTEGRRWRGRVSYTTQG